jgi:hypothetical protein
MMCGDVLDKAILKAISSVKRKKVDEIEASADYASASQSIYDSLFKTA